MNVNRVLEVHERVPVRRLREFMGTLWREANLNAVMAPFEQPVSSFVIFKECTNPVELEKFNPFIPVMHANAALSAIDFIGKREGQRVAIILRPCELRAFTELKKRRAIQFDVDSTIIIGVDCLGTFPREDFSSLVEVEGIEYITADVLRNAAEGGLRPQHFRTACQICDWSGPKGADITIGTIGVNSDQFLLVIVKDENTEDQLKVTALTDDTASEYQVSHREIVVGAIADTRADMREHLFSEVNGMGRFDELGSFLAWMANCSLCGRCLSACPLYRGEFKGKFGQVLDTSSDRHVLSELVNLGRWIALCSGCGMCEQSCDRNVPLTLLLSSLSHRIRRELNYSPGDPIQQAPWL
ncbi:MAG: Coenzyme F420 hydrogenase/dehydrogenase, beta subunit C-terminal domain [Anaerolineales bacterium]